MYKLELLFRKEFKDFGLPRLFKTCAPINIGSSLFLTKDSLFFKSTKIVQHIEHENTHVVTTENGSIYRVKEFKKELADELVTFLRKHNNDERHCYKDPCQVCEMLEEVDAIEQRLRKE